ncbi:homoserine kinase [Sphingosinicella soli]|uniref:Homoserine kinase n=1 Tax=Sphingosinicella soli TaxID=333708 RepID=A0A7W7B0Y5_9SPHN|nr:homoserine kinase type II [Sphingosinicella soli]
MAVYTHVPGETLAVFIARYDIGDLVAAKGIAEGVENSNYLIDTTRGRYILTLYEKRVDTADLPYFLALMRHAAEGGLPVPRPIEDREGAALQDLAGRPACVIEFLTGISVTEPTPALCRAAGEALGRLHAVTADFKDIRANALGHEGRLKLGAQCLPRADEIDPALAALIESEMAFQAAHWPADLPQATIHADLFPDNVLALGETVTGIIDFYFACTDARAYDLAVMHGAWCFSNDGAVFYPERAEALQAGYRAAHPISEAEAAVMPVLQRAAALRFLLTRAWDWLNTPADALVTRKDPMAFARRLRHLREAQ